MGRVTTENFRKLERAEKYEDAAINVNDNNAFTTVLGQLIEKKNISTLTIVEKTNLSKSYINKLRNPSEKSVKPGRNVIIDIALAIDADLNETNNLLKLAKYQELYTRDSAESLIIWGMLKKLSGDKIRQLLQEKGLDSIFSK